MHFLNPKAFTDSTYWPSPP